MNFQNSNIDTSLLSPTLTGELSALPYLIDGAQKKLDQYDFFEHLCCFVVPFLSKLNSLQPLRNLWEDKRKKHQKEKIKFERQVVSEIQNACELLQKRVREHDFKTREDVLKELSDIQQILKTGGGIYSPHYYEVAACELVQICYELLKHQHLISGIIEIDALIKFNPAMPTTTFIKGFQGSQISFCRSLRELYKLQENTCREYPEEIWVIWERLYVAYLAWHLPESYFKRPGFETGTLIKIQKANSLFQLQCYWDEMQRIRFRRPPKEGDSCFFLPSEYLRYLNTLISEIVCWNGLKDKQLDITNNSNQTPYSKPYYAIELWLEGNELLLIIEHEKGDEREILLLHSFNEESVPLQFFKAAISNVGKEVNLREFDKGDQSVAKILCNVKINDPLRKLLFSGSTKCKRTLKQTRVILQEHPKKVANEITDYIKNLGLTQIEGSLLSIDPEKINEARK